MALEPPKDYVAEQKKMHSAVLAMIVRLRDNFFSRYCRVFLKVSKLMIAWSFECKCH